MRSFEGVIYNEDVKRLAKQCECHPKYEDAWQNDHVIEIFAHDLDHARQRFKKVYPRHDGFVIKDVFAI